MHIFQTQKISALYHILLLLAFGIVFFFILQGQPTYAQDAPGTTPTTGVGDAIGGFFGGAWNVITGSVSDATAATFDVLVFKPIAWFIYAICVAVGGLIVGIGGLTLDLSVGYLIVGMGNFFAGSGSIGSTIAALWKVVRDILNIFFIFGLIYIGIKTILNAEDSNTRRALGYLIIAALMINFSLYITQAIVDFSNIAATQMYNQILDGAVGAAGGQGSNTAIGGLVKLSNDSITLAFLDIINITSFFGGSGIADVLTTPQIITFALLLLIFFIMAGFVFLISGIRVIYRFIALLLYMVFSPLLFLGMILPKFESKSKEWWNGFLKNCFFAPAFLFLIYVSLLVMRRLESTLLGTGDFTTLYKGGAMTANEFTIFLFFTMMIGFLYASVKVGDLMAVAGAQSTGKLFDAGIKSMRGAIQGAAYRGTVGAGLNKVVGGIDALDRAAESGTGVKGWALRRTRDLIGGESTRKAIESASNYGAGGLGREALEKDNKTRAQRAGRGTQIQTAKKAIAASVKDPNNLVNKIDLEKAITGSSTDQLVEMLGDNKPGSQAYGAIVGSMTQDQFESVMKEKPEIFSESEKSDLLKERTKAIRQRLVPPVATGQPPRTEDQEKAAFIKAIKDKATTDELVTLGFDALRENSQFIPDSKMVEILKNKKFSQTQKDLLSEERKAKIENANIPDLANIIADQKDKDIARLPKKLFTEPGYVDKMLRFINSRPGVLDVIGSASGDNVILNQAERYALKGYLTRPGQTVSLAVSAYLNSEEGVKKFGP